MEGQTLILIGKAQRDMAKAGIDRAPDGWAVRIQPNTRTMDQNSRLWPMLADVAAQVSWHGTNLDTDEWKDMFTAALKRTKVIPGLTGGFVTCGMSTSRMNKRDFSDLIELIYAFGAERDVKWTEPSHDR